MRENDDRVVGSARTFVPCPAHGLQFISSSVQYPALLTRLNIETRPHHHMVDAAWLELTTNRASLATYQRLLVRVHGFEAPLEGAFLYTPRLNLVVDLRARAKSGAIVRDLLALGLRPQQIAELPQCREIVPFRNMMNALGWMYVTERATLLHGGVHRHLVTKLPQSNDATAYLRSYDRMVSARWNELGMILDQVANNDELAQQVVDGAHDAFRCQLRWYRDESHQHRRGA